MGVGAVAARGAARLETVMLERLRAAWASTRPRRTSQVPSCITGKAWPVGLRYMAERGTLSRCASSPCTAPRYQLKEADPHTWAIPRLSGRRKAAIMEIQADEYGAGPGGPCTRICSRSRCTHSGSTPTYGAYLDRLPGDHAGDVNIVSFFGLHRRWRGALVGHLALFEMTSVEPMGRYSRRCDGGLRPGRPALLRRARRRRRAS